MRILLGLVCLLVAYAVPAAAQLSVTTLGATDAASCFENARDDFSRDTGPCDDALLANSTTRGDRKKTYVNRGIILNRIGNTDMARADFNAALEIDESLAEAYLNRGNAHYLSKNYDDALSDYERSLELDISKPWAAWYNIGLVYEAKGLAEDAHAAYEEALRMNPNFYEAQQKLEKQN
ncbi:tetratricopeptide repeat protein [Hyphococcus sp.]|uniref:tetratricopeptide repeat protein n=1 Tax=Hyphococcus sp. TaxID=2038636 RepID=UPI00208A1FC2|nr:MAG: hypothetical protein DHS20C04_04350 [Marinicaulis sp.]